MKLFLISAIVAVAFCYDMDPSGYGGNDAEAVKKVAAASPRVRPRDYTSNGKPINDPVTIHKYTVPSVPSVGTIVGNKFDLTNLSQLNNQGQSSVQVGGEQTNVGSNANAINVGQTNQNAGSGKGSAGYPAPQYDSKYAPSYPAANTYVPQIPSYGGAGAAGDLIKNNLFNVQNLGQTSSQGQENVQVGGAQTNVGSNQNAINVGQTNQNGGQGSGAGYGAPQYDSKYAPSYPQPTYQQPNYAQYLPQNIFAGNLVNSKDLSQNNQQGQSNTQVGGAQTNVGSNANAINVGQTNQNGGQGSGAGYPAPQYDSSKYAPSYGQGYQQQPSYGTIGQYLPQNIFAGNKVDYTGLAQNNAQGQSNTQVGGAQTNAGSNQNAINVGQTNQNGGQGSGAGYPAPQYDSKYAPSYPQPTYTQQPSYPQPSYGSGASYIPQNVFAGNKVDYTGLAQGNNQGQSSVQQGGAQTNVGQNTNTINVGQTNNNGGQGSGAGYGAPQYDSKYAPSYPQPSYGNAGAGYLPQNLVAGNLFNLQNLGQNNQQGQSSTQVGGEQTNVGSNANAINVGQTNQNGGGKAGAGYQAPAYDAPVGYLLLKNQPSNYVGNNAIWSQLMGQNNQQGQTNTQVGGAQTNVGENTNTINVGQTNNNGGGKAPQYDSYKPVNPGYGAIGTGYAGQFLPQNIFAGNLVNTKDLAQTNAQGQNSIQKGGDQLNLNTNQNTINVGQTNNNGGQGSPSYDAKLKPAVMPVKQVKIIKAEPEPEQSYRRRA